MKKTYSVMGIGVMFALMLGACAPQIVEVPGEVITVPEVVTVEVPVAAEEEMAEEIEPVTILASWGGDEETGFREVLDAFTAKTGIPYTYEGSRAVTVLLTSRVAGGSPPDVAMLPRPGVMVALAREGSILPLDGVRGDEILPPDILTDNYSQAWIDLGTVDNLFYGLTVKANSKSTFWYKPASFEALGVSSPNTWDELTAIADAYLAAG